MSAFPSHQLHIAKAMWPNYQVHFTLQTAWNEIQTAHKYKYFWGAQCLNLFFSLLKLLPHKLTLPLFVSHWWLLNERLAFWKFVHKIASMKLHPFPHSKSTNFILQLFIHGIWLLMQKKKKKNYKSAIKYYHKSYFLHELYYILRFFRWTSIQLCWVQIHITPKNGYKTNMKFEFFWIFWSYFSFSQHTTNQERK